MTTQAAVASAATAIRLRGIVQGVGMRPMICRLARELRLRGDVCNQGGEVLIQLWAAPEQIAAFLKHVLRELPRGARIDDIVQSTISGFAPAEFGIVPSIPQQHSAAGVVPDRATCQECLIELCHPHNRRFQHPFINCTDCGPRFSILKTLPWDRRNTAMQPFAQCPSCQNEFESLPDRRFHAQPNACAECGPELFYSRDGKSQRVTGVSEAISDIGKGLIVAIQGMACVHLACDASNPQAVQLLRTVKRRPAKPLALMASSVAMIRRYAICSKEEEQLLCSPAAPIVLLRKNGVALPETIAPGLNRLGFMLANTPLHHLLFTVIDTPLVLTSANVTGNTPICDAAEAFDALPELSANVLFHNRRITHRLDDSVSQVIAAKPQLLRRARGYVPSTLPLPSGFSDVPPVLAYGAHMKSSFCLLSGQQALLSAWIGELDSPEQRQDYQNQLNDYVSLFQFQAATLACDSHPNYFTSEFAEANALKSGLPLHRISHHHAHAAAVMAEHGRALSATPILAIIFDGNGLGPDGSIWGGEFLLADYTRCDRLAHIGTYPLIGGEPASKQGWRCLWSQLETHFSWTEICKNYPGLPFIPAMQIKPLATLRGMVASGSNCPITSSAGRLFDAVAAALGLCFERSQYESEAAMKLQTLAEGSDDCYAYPLTIDDQGAVLKLNVKSMWQALLRDLCAKLDKAIIARRFHNGLAMGICEMSCRLFQRNAEWQERTVILSGGVFQNALLSENCEQVLNAAGFQVLRANQVPANDSGLALGQAFIAAATQLTVTRGKDLVCV